MYFGQTTIRKWIGGRKILKVGEEYNEWSRYISQLRPSKAPWVLETKLGMKTWKTVDSYTSLTHRIKAYLLPLMSFSSVMAIFEMFP